MKKIDYAIMRLNEFILCNEYQGENRTLEDGNRILKIITKEMEKMK